MYRTGCLLGCDVRAMLDQVDVACYDAVFVWYQVPGTAGSGTLVCLRRRRCLLLGRLDVARMDGLTIIQPHHAKNELTSKIDEHYFDG